MRRKNTSKKHRLKGQNAGIIQIVKLAGSAPDTPPLQSTACILWKRSPAGGSEGLVAGHWQLEPNSIDRRR